MKQDPNLRRALERIADSQPRPKRNGDYSAFDIDALQRIARFALGEDVSCRTTGKDFRLP